MSQDASYIPGAISLLWQNQSALAQAPSSTRGSHDDLRIRFIAEAIAPHRDYLQPILKTLSTLLVDSATISYRHEVIADCLRNPQFTSGLAELLPLIRALQNTVRDIRARRREVTLVLSRLTELEDYVECVNALHGLLQRFLPELEARAWHKLATQLQQTVEQEEFQQMMKELPELRAEIREIVSVTIGVNLSPDLKPVGATLLSLNRRRFKGPRFLPRLWGNEDDEDLRGLGPLHESTQARQNLDGSVLVGRHATLDRLESSRLFSDLARILDDVIRPINKALEAYSRVNSRFLRAIEPEIAFFVGAALLIERLRKQGLPMCKPQMLPLTDRRLETKNLYNLDLALRLNRQHGGESLSEHIVGSDALFGDAGRIHILTGPNRGGKTTWVQAIGLLHILAQSGLYLPAESAAISPVDAIYSHFPVEEDPTMESGRLGEEAKRLREIFKRASAYSLILLNESLASTSATESFFLARDVLSCLRIMGARAVFVTHLHELAADCENINNEVAGESRVQSFIADVEDESAGVRRTFRVIAAPPRGQSYAREIARQYGISFEQLRQLVEGQDGRLP